MPAAVLPFRSAAAARRATWSLLEIARAGHDPEPLGILLVDEESGELTLRLREPGSGETENRENGFQEMEEQEADFLAALGPDLEAKARESGGLTLLASLEDSLSGFLRIGDRQAIAYSGDARHTVDKLFDEHVDRDIRPFVTHLPLCARPPRNSGTNSIPSRWPSRSPGCARPRGCARRKACSSRRSPAAPWNR